MKPSNAIKFFVSLCGIVSVASQDFFENTGENDPLLQTWIKEEELFANIQQKLESPPTISPSISPISSPTRKPTLHPTRNPTRKPTVGPTTTPTTTPSELPSSSPTMPPSLVPSESPTSVPSTTPTISPSSVPSASSEPTDFPSAFPSRSPSSAPSQSPSVAPSSNPTLSLSPSHSPSNSPSSSPTSVPSSAPSSSPSTEPTKFPTSSPTPQPSSLPSVMPSSSPSTAPSFSPSMKPTRHPTSVPTSPPTPKPTEGPTSLPTASPTSSPTESISPTVWKTNNSSVIINNAKAKKSTSLLIVGACCFVVMASTGAYLYKRNSQHQLGNRDSTPVMIDLSLGKDDDGVMSSFSHDAPGMGPGFCSTTLVVDTRHDENSDAIDRDLEVGRNGGIPTSVAVAPSPRQQGTLPTNLSVSANTETEHSLSSMVRNHYFNAHKLFQKSTKSSEQNASINLTWAQMRDQVSPCSSGYAPASAASPMFSPVFVKGMPNTYSAAAIPASLTDETCVNDNAEERKEQENSMDEHSASSCSKSDAQAVRDGSSEPCFGVDAQSASIRTSQSEETESLIGTRALERHSDEAMGCGEPENSLDAMKSSMTTCTRVSDASSVEWNIDVCQSVNSYDENVDNLRTLSIDDSNPPASNNGEEHQVAEVQMSYTESPGGESISGEQSVASSAVSFLGDLDATSMKSEMSLSGKSEASNDLPVSANQRNLTYERELLHSSEIGGRPINFKHVFNDPKNELYECHVPPGSLGVVVDTTPLGLRVNSLNPLSPLFGTVAAGDIIVGVDELDTVGMESGDFMQIVTQRSKEEIRILTVLRI